MSIKLIVFDSMVYIIVEFHFQDQIVCSSAGVLSDNGKNSHTGTANN